MKIILSSSQGKEFASVDSFNKANEVARAVFKRQYWSDIHYDIRFDDGSQGCGSIDLEPKCFHSRNQREIVSTHVKTYWENVSKLSVKNPYGITSEYIKTVNKLLMNLNK